MAGGGTAPPLKLGDVLLLIGVSVLIGTLFIQEWDIPVKINPEDEPLEGTSQTFSGDVLTISVVTEQESNVRIEIFEDDEPVQDVTLFSDSATAAEVSHESNGGKLAWKVSLELNVAGEVDVDLNALLPEFHSLHPWRTYYNCRCDEEKIRCRTQTRRCS